MTNRSVFYEPQLSIDKALLASIVQKTFNWISQIDPDNVDRGSYENLEWHKRVFMPMDPESTEKSLDAYTISIDGAEVVQTVGELAHPKQVWGFKSWMDNVVGNLDKFVALEKQVYDILEKLDTEKQALALELNEAEDE